MRISEEQTKRLLELIINTKQDELGCDDCFHLLAEFAEHKLAGMRTSDAMQSVASHLSLCECCDYEHDSLIEALTTLGSIPRSHVMP